MAILAECPICRNKQSVRNKVCKCGEDLDRAKRSGRVRYWINYRYTDTAGKRKQRRELVGYSIDEARAANGKAKAKKAEGRILDILPDTTMTFNDLTQWYLGLEKTKALASYWLVELSLKKFNKVFGNTVVSKIKPADLENYQIRRAREGLAPGTIDHEIGKAKTMVIKAFDNDMVGADTLKAFRKVKKTLKRGSDVRGRVLSFKEFNRLMLRLPLHLKPVIAMGFYTGMRKGEILGLTWDRLDLKERTIRLEAEHTKDREKRIIPICEPLLKILRDVPRAIHDPHVFQYRGKPIADIRKGLRKACKEAAIEYGRFAPGGFIFHDLRHSFNTHMRRAGVSEGVIMKITGHSTREMFDRYDTVDLSDTRQALEVFSASVDQTVDQEKIS